MTAQAFADQGLAEKDTIQARIAVQSSYTRFLQELEQRATAEKARAFAMRVTHGNSAKFRGMNREEVYKLLTGNDWPGS